MSEPQKPDGIPIPDWVKKNPLFKGIPDILPDHPPIISDIPLQQPEKPRTRLQNILRAGKQK